MGALRYDLRHGLRRSDVGTRRADGQSGCREDWKPTSVPVSRNQPISRSLSLCRLRRKICCGPCIRMPSGTTRSSSAAVNSWYQWPRSLRTDDDGLSAHRDDEQESPDRHTAGARPAVRKGYGPPSSHFPCRVNASHPATFRRRPQAHLEALGIYRTRPVWDARRTGHGRETDSRARSTMDLKFDGGQRLMGD